MGDLTFRQLAELCIDSLILQLIQVFLFCFFVLFQWANPFTMVKDYIENRVLLAPPQLYETSRMINFNDVISLLCFLKKRVGQPFDRWMPVRIQCCDGVLYAFPG